MTRQPGRLAPQERRALLAGPVYRVIGTPVVAALGLVNTAIIVRETGPEVFGLVALIATITLLLPFADLGIGATVLSAGAQLSQPELRQKSVDVIRRSYQVLFGVAAAIAVASVVLMAVDGWQVLVGFSSGGQDRWAITVAALIWALTIPAGLGLRILIGIDRNPLATLVMMSCPAFGLLLTLLLWSVDVSGIWYCISALGGLLVGQLVGTVLALRLSGLGRSAFGRVSREGAKERLLAGSLWLFVVGLGLPIGLQSGRVLLAHLSNPEQLSSYSLMAQIYGIGWSVISTAGLAYWPVFVKRRAARDETVRMWWRITAVFAGIAVLAAVGMWALGPWAARILSGGTITVSAWLALGFGLLLVCQAVHLPASVLLTLPTEARWLASWTLLMAVVSIGLGCWWAPMWGATGVVTAAALAILCAQIIPDLSWTPRLVRRRPSANA
ncbi:oligosaccharide flippase family protein [Gordonia sp. CPCC 205515]|uniref:lipopolysaccharide biosynthesis protein n=1 Tax=Gordonia sp. CPCC 205515 TaxID=3140791 RepID=UPI003AF351F6